MARTSNPVLAAGPLPENAAGCLILLHGRGASAADILSLHEELALPTLSALAPQAPANTWYPYSFLAPITANQPFLDHSLAQVDSLITDLITRKIPQNKIAILGFSQGACLAVEYAARHPRPYAALIAFTGGLIGPPGTLGDYPGSLVRVPVFLGAGDPDPHVPFQRVEETRDVLARMGATVDIRRYPGMPHTINADELAAARALLAPIIT